MPRTNRARSWPTRTSCPSADASSTTASWSRWSTARSTSGSRRGATRERFETRVRALVRDPGMRARQLGLEREPLRAHGAHVARARRTAPAPRRRDHHAGRGLPDHREPDRSGRLRARLRRQRADARTTRDLSAVRARALAQDAGRHHRAHARQPLRPRSRARLLPRARPVDDRGHLRRRRRDVERPAGGHVRRPRDRQLLSGPPHDDGRRRRGADAARRSCARSSSRFATGAATAGARRARTTRAASASTGSSATCRTATTTSTSTATSATTSS